MALVFYNGLIHTMDAGRPLAQAVLIENGRFAAVGQNDDILALGGPAAEAHDLGGAAVYPGLIDSHLHILNLAITSHELALGGIRTRSGIFDALAEQAKRETPGSVIDGRGFNQDLWDDRRLVTRRELDAAVPGYGVRLTRVCGHMVIANTLAMERAGITPDTPVPDGGEMDYDNGIFSENAIDLLYRGGGDAPADGEAELSACKRLLAEGMTMAADAGLTAIFSDDFGTGGYDMTTVAAAYRALEAEGGMTVRVVQQCAVGGEEGWQAFLEAGFAYGQGTDMYRIGPRKLYADGSLGARTAWLSAPYADAGDRRGVPIYSQDELNSHARRSHEAGMPFIVHAIGDAAADSVLEAVEYARRAVPGTDSLPDGIVHCQITRPDTLSRIIRDHVCVYAQPVFAEYDLHICRDRVGAELEKSSYNWKTLLDGGVCLSSGSDCPVEPLDPAKNIYCAVTRKDFDRFPEGGWMSEQRLSVDEAVFCHTVQAARSVGLDDRLGRIMPGYLADLSVYPLDFEAVAPDRILNQKPLMTVVGGRIRPCPR